MKYLPINQSILKAECKYSFDHFASNTYKAEFNKSKNKKLFLMNHYFNRLFNKYLHNDIDIFWYVEL